MEKATKIVAILVLVVSISFLFFAAKTIDRIELQKKLITSLQENITSLQNTIDSLSEVINLAKGEVGSLRTLAEQLKGEISKAIVEKEKAEKALAEAKRENQKLNTELKEAKAKTVILTDELRKQQPQGIVEDIIPAGTDLESMVSQLSRKLRGTENKLAAAQDKIATLESMGILLEREADTASMINGIPQVVKEIEGEIIDVKSSGIVAITFKGSINPKKGSTFYIIDSADQVRAKLALEDVYNTILVANMDIEKQNYDIKSGDNVKLILWTE